MALAIHTGDLHIKIPENNEAFYIERFKNYVDAVISEDFDTLIISGDVFDKTPTCLEVSLFLYFLDKVSDSLVYIVTGNHDVGNKRKQAIRYNYVTAILDMLQPANVIYTDDILEHDKFLLVSNQYIREKREIPVDKSKILVSHIRHELKFGNKVKRSEYDLMKLLDFQLVLLSDIHSTVNYFDNIWYSTSPYRTFVKTISDIEQIDDSIFGYNKVDLETNKVEHVELYLPNVYKMIVDEDTVIHEYTGIIDLVYEVNLEDLSKVSGKNIKVKRNYEAIDLQENLYEIINEILRIDYNIKEPEEYMTKLLAVMGDL